MMMRWEKGTVPPLSRRRRRRRGRDRKRGGERGFGSRLRRPSPGSPSRKEKDPLYSFGALALVPAAPGKRAPPLHLRPWGRVARPTELDTPDPARRAAPPASPAAAPSVSVGVGIRPQRRRLPFGRGREHRSGGGGWRLERAYSSRYPAPQTLGRARCGVGVALCRNRERST